VTKAEHDATRPVPVLVLLHAYSTPAEVLERSFGAQEIAFERDWIVAIPEGTRNSSELAFWNASLACCDRDRARPDDVGFLKRMLLDIERRYAVDRNRVYALGVSNGGFMAHRWACEPGGDLRAIVSIAGAGPTDDDYRCEPTRSVSVLELHGDTDDVVAYDGGLLNERRYPSVHATVDGWKRVNGCAPGAKPAREQRSRLFEFPMEIERYDCPNGRVEVMTVHGGGHKMPVGSSLRGELVAFLDEQR
jgi:polyhydroxybutyrate depolymerase